MKTPCAKNSSASKPYQGNQNAANLLARLDRAKGRHAEEGLITTASAHSFAESLLRLETALHEKGMTIFARVDHAAGAAAVNLSLRPTTLLIFGNPKGGTPLMLVDQKIGLELPLKILVWEDESGKSWLSYDDPAWLAQRFGVDPTLAAVAALSAALAAFADLAGRP